MTEVLQLFPRLPAPLINEMSRRARIHKTSCVYFIQAESGPIKIGTAKYPLSRLKALQTGSPYRLRLVGLLLGEKAIEQALQQQFTDVRLTGEWFAPNALLTEAVRQIRWEQGVAE